MRTTEQTNRLNEVKEAIAMRDLVSYKIDDDRSSVTFYIRTWDHGQSRKKIALDMSSALEAFGFQASDFQTAETEPETTILYPELTGKTIEKYDGWYSETKKLEIARCEEDGDYIDLIDSEDYRIGISKETLEKLIEKGEAYDGHYIDHCWIQDEYKLR